MRLVPVGGGFGSAAKFSTHDSGDLFISYNALTEVTDEPVAHYVYTVAAKCPARPDKSRGREVKVGHSVIRVCDQSRRCTCLILW